MYKIIFETAVSQGKTEISKKLLKELVSLAQLLHLFNITNKNKKEEFKMETFTSKTAVNPDIESGNMSREELSQLDLSDPKVLDSIVLEKQEYAKGILMSLVFTAIAIFVFFVPITFNGKSGQIPFGIIYNTVQGVLGNAGLGIVALVIAGNALASIYGKYIAKEGKIYDYYSNDSSFHPILHSVGAIFIVTFFLNTVFGIAAPEMIIGERTGQMVIPPVVYGVACIILVGAIFVPFLIDYGFIDFLGIILEPLMRPLFKTPGKSAVDAVASFVGSASMAVIITSRMYKSNNYTERESSVVATCFSAVSVGYAMLMIGTAGLGEKFALVYFSAFVMAFIIAGIMTRIPPLSRKADKYYNGRLQTEEERQEAKLKIGPSMVKVGVSRAAKRAYISGNIFGRIKESVADGVKVIPKVITLLCAVGTTGMILLEYTEIFTWIGYAFYPLLKLLNIPDAIHVGPSMIAGITDPFLPILVIADKVSIMSEASRYFICVVAMVQIIYVAETAVVIITTGLKLKFKELMVIFLERTIIAMFIGALFMHIIF